jgi:hypothetical protein
LPKGEGYFVLEIGSIVPWQDLLYCEQVFSFSADLGCMKKNKNL